MKKNNLLNVVVFSLGVNIFPDLQTETTKTKKLVALPLNDKNSNTIETIDCFWTERLYR